LSWLGQPGRQELAFNHIFKGPTMRHSVAPRPDHDPTVHTLTRMSPSEPLGQPILWAGWVALFLSRPAPGCSVQWTGTSGGPEAASARAPTVRSRPAPSKPAPDCLFTLALTLCRCLSCAASTSFWHAAASAAVGEGGGGRGGVGGDRRAPAAPLGAAGRPRDRVKSAVSARP
jgi:hypothetical protein